MYGIERSVSDSDYNTPSISDRQMVEITKIREINITELDRGFLVRVGCHSFAISTKEELTTKLIEYINEPQKTEEKWFSGKLF